MMPVIRISERTWERLKGYAIPLEDTPEDAVNRIIDELEKLKSGRAVAAPSANDGQKALAPQAKPGGRGEKLPQKEFRRPLMETVYELGGRASTAQIRPIMEKKMASRLSEADYGLVSTGDPRWWNAICWERNDLVREHLFRSDSPRGIWELSERGIAEIERRLARKVAE